MSYKVIHTLLIAAASYILALAVTNNLILYIHPRYILFTVVMAAIGLILSILSFFSTKAKMPLKTFVTFMPILVLVILGLTLPATSLSSFSVNQRSDGDIGANTVSRDSSTLDLYSGSSKNLKLIDWARLLSRNKDPDYYADREVNVTGFVFDEGKPDSFQIARFVVTCCAVDAQPTGIEVYSPGWRSRFKQDQWLKITGEISEAEINGKQALVIKPAKISKIPEPDNPYAN